MKTFNTNLLGKKYLEQYPKITIKSLFLEIENKIKEEILKTKLDWINLIYTKANYWWTRKWFECPNCKQKCFSVYNTSSWFKCRKCLWLPYKSQKFNGMLEEKFYKTKKPNIMQKN